MTTGEKPVKGSLGKPISFRLSEADRLDYLQKVEASGLSQSDFFRQAILTKTSEVIVKAGASHDHKRMLYVLNTINNKLNAIGEKAVLSHLGSAISEETCNEVLDQLDMISRLLKQSIPPVN